MTDRKRDSVEGGLCVGPDGQEANCALERAACSGTSTSSNAEGDGVSLTFMSSRQIQNYPNAHGGNCLQGATILDSPVGRCVSGSSSSSYCASDRSLCVDSGMTWYAPGTEEAQGCTVAKDLSSSSDDTIPTLYGKCGDVDCAWSNVDCSESFQLQGPDCSCDKVRVGGCVSPSNVSIVFCAVSSEACDDQMEYMSPQELSISTATDCFLCREGDSSGDEGFFSPVITSTNGSSSGGDSNMTVVGGTIGGVAFVLAIVAAVWFRRQKASVAARRSQLEEEGNQNKLPDDLNMEVEVTNSSNGSHKKDKDGDKLEDDRVSELGHDDL